MDAHLVALALLGGLAGLAGEVLFTGVMDLLAPGFLCSWNALGAGAPTRERPAWRLSRDPRAQGYSFLWMAPIYAAATLLMHWTEGACSGWPRPPRLGALVAIIYTVELVSGAALQALLGRCPWDYSYSRWSLRGWIRLDYLPVWLGVAYVADAYWSRFEALARAAAQIFASP